MRHYKFIKHMMQGLLFIGVMLGLLTLRGTLTVVDTPHASSYAHGLGGTLDYAIDYSAANTTNLSGTVYFQIAAFSSLFNGIGDCGSNAHGPTCLGFALWGSHGGPDGAPLVGTHDTLGFDIVVANASRSEDTGQMIPNREPASLSLLVLGLLAFWTYKLWRRQRL
jgi:hypothetical protein